MNIQQLRQSVKMKWLSYYKQNRHWLEKMRIWGTYDALRRPSSGFILATLSVLEPQFDQILAFLMDLSNNPDKIVAALGLNFNPDEELRLVTLEHSTTEKQVQNEPVEEKSLLSVAIATQVDAEKLPSDLSRTHQSVASLTTPEIAETHRYVSAMLLQEADQGTMSNEDKPLLDETLRDRVYAVPTKITPHTPITPSQPAKLPSGFLPQNKPMRSLVITTEISSNGKAVPLLALATEVPTNSKSVRSLAITTKVPGKAKTLPVTLATAIPSKDKYINTPTEDIPKKVNLSPSTNARSLATWVDEFCQGTGWDRDEDIFIQF